MVPPSQQVLLVGVSQVKLLDFLGFRIHSIHLQHDLPHLTGNVWATKIAKWNQTEFVFTGLYLQFTGLF